MTDDPELNAPSAQRVAKRALVLAAVTCRSAIEGDAGDPNARRFQRDIIEWLGELGIRTEAEESELQLLETELGSLPERSQIDASWRSEGLGVLAWALGRSGLPSYERSVVAPDVAEDLGFMRDSARELLDSAQLRTPDDLQKLADVYFTLHWRLRQFSMDQKPMDFVTFSKECWFGPLETDGLSLVGGDLGVEGRPLSDLPEDGWRYCLSIARERQQAANWLLGTDEVYSEVSCDT